MRSRPATRDDLPAIAALQERWETRWFGAPEQDLHELDESFGKAEPLAERSLVLLGDEDRLLGAAWWYQETHSHVVVDPELDPAPLYDELLPFLRSSGSRSVEALDRDTALLDALGRHGWRHHVSAFELIRDVTGGWQPDPPSWPEGIEVTTLRPGDEDTAHEMIYRRTGWTDIPGHHHRGYDEWRSLFLPEAVPYHRHVLAWEDGRLLGIAVGRVFSDGTGWVSQLAVDRDQQGRGLGRALLLESFARSIEAGATKVGLSVSAENRGALGLYQRVGLEIDREWLEHEPAPQA